MNDSAYWDLHSRAVQALHEAKLTEAEQRALSDFLTPVQRARYLALQENLRSRVEQQRGRVRRGPGDRPTPPPSGPR